MFKVFTLISFSILILISSFSFISKEEIKKDTNWDEVKFKTEYIVVFVIDGPRYSETFGDTSYTLIPRMGKEMMKEGVYFRDFRNNGVTHTTPGHTAIMTGVYQSIKNDGSQLPKNPSFMQYYLKQSGADKSSCWVISSKGKLNVLGQTRDKAWKNQFYPSRYCGLNGDEKEYQADSRTWVKIQDIFTNSAPKLTLINLLAADVRGHENKWEEYKLAIKDCDEYVYQFWKMVQNNPKMKDKTSIFITNDHGRHLDGHKKGFVEHGDGCEGCRHISLLAIGPDFKKGVLIDRERELIDISKTISTMFHFEMPTTQGKFMNELFVQ
ncbi:MAG: sulfatase-like hydrolase/transferase [Flavobacteriia bacterium]|jgi:hypothetical protein